jgi:hypothetical protein
VRGSKRNSVAGPYVVSDVGCTFQGVSLRSTLRGGGGVPLVRGEEQEAYWGKVGIRGALLYVLLQSNIKGSHAPSLGTGSLPPNLLPTSRPTGVRGVKSSPSRKNPPPTLSQSMVWGGISRYRNVDV